MKKHFLFSLLGIFFFANSHSQITVSPAGGPANIAAFLSGYGVTISNVVFTGDTNAIGYFTAANTSLNMTAGLGMTTGDMSDLVGPNNSTGYGNNNGQPGDSELTALAQCPTYNAAILEFDCIPNFDTLYFNYVFGSEEYMEYVSGGFNDVFAIFISGPNIPVQNMAWLPNSTIPVSCVNVNSNTNSTYYVDRTNDPYIQFDGTTTNLLATIPVVPDSTYHIRIGIADALDGIVDGGVMLQGGSFRCANPNGISTASNDNGINMFPVPANNTVNFIFKKLVDPNVQITIHSLSGQEILSQNNLVNASGTTSIDISNFAQGMYVVEIIADGSKEARLLPVTRK